MCLNEMLLVPNGYKKLDFLDGILTKKNMIFPATPRNIRNLDSAHIVYNKIPCGYCEECLLKRSQEWSIRLIKESLYHKNNYFITLTYDESHLPDKASLRKEDLILFFRSLRKHFERLGKPSPKYFACGEYGETSFRPHYHAIIYDLDLEDVSQLIVDGVPYITGTGELTYKSDYLSSLWSKGFVTINNVTTESCRYVAGYVQKKLYKKDSIQMKDFTFSQGVNGEPLVLDILVRKSIYEVLGISEPFSIMSKGLGLSYFEENKESIYKCDKVVFNTAKGVRERTPPRYFDKRLALEDSKRVEDLKAHRKSVAVGKSRVDTRGDSVIIQSMNEKRLKVIRNCKSYKRLVE